VGSHGAGHPAERRGDHACLFVREVPAEVFGDARRVDRPHPARACQNSPQAARRLEALGYGNVYDYEEGKQDWIEARLPTESGAAA
jgi:hypothetical protein